MVGFLIKRSHQGGLLADNCPPLKGFGGQNNPSDGRHPLTAFLGSFPMYGKPQLLQLAVSFKPDPSKNVYAKSAGE